MSNSPQQFNGGEYVDKARDAARDHPDQARGAIDKVQEAVDKRTGGKFRSIIDKAGDFVEDKLGLPEEKKAEPEGDASPKADPEPQGDSSTGGGALPG
ncbi:antitoxin [Janibacter indicus]|uniref:MT0933-like antitoxin protein n=1 Tax=Janibacter indicus TaxID=857417 RepID=A0A1W1ZR94_9MICO|nr:antitoxin [Janibacter indicus]SMC51065.1 MT0933-like antitoxin protein [Janibacter indicus]